MQQRVGCSVAKRKIQDAMNTRKPGSQICGGGLAINFSRGKTESEHTHNNLSLRKRGRSKLYQEVGLLTVMDIRKGPFG